MKTAPPDGERNLIRRYLLWCYKTTQEELDRIDRKFTQLKVDRLVLKELLKRKAPPPAGTDNSACEKFIEEFKEYILKKEKDAHAAKFADDRKKIPRPRYVYLKNRVLSLEKTIVAVLGTKEFKKIVSLYEAEMTRRILEAREHT